MSKSTDYFDQQLIENYRGRLDGELIKRSLPDFLDWLTDEYRQHIEIVREQQQLIEALIKMLKASDRPPSGLPFDPTLTERELKALADKIDKPVVKWGENCWIWGRLYFQYGPNPLTQVTHSDISGGPYPGPLETIEETLLRPMEALLGRLPNIEDIGRHNIDGITTDELLNILGELTLYHLGKADGFDKRRMKFFIEYWPKMEATDMYEPRKEGKTNPKYLSARMVALKAFKSHIAEIFKNYDRRRNGGLT